MPAGAVGPELPERELDPDGVVSVEDAAVRAACGANGFAFFMAFSCSLCRCRLLNDPAGSQSRRGAWKRGHKCLRTRSGERVAHRDASPEPPGGGAAVTWKPLKGRREILTGTGGTVVQMISRAAPDNPRDPFAPTTYVEHHRSGAMSVGTYRVAAGCDDDQEPHRQDEVYVVSAGRGKLSAGGRALPVVPGDVLFVPAGEPHRFCDVTEDLALLVVFAPPFDDELPT